LTSRGGRFHSGAIIIFSADGVQLATLDEVVAFAACDDGSWIARSRTAAMKLDRTGAVLWKIEMPALSENRGYQPIVDCRSYSYFIKPGGLICLNPFADRVFDLSLRGTCVVNLALVADGKIAAVTNGCVFLVT
jgi:hypothetical protein